MALVRLLHLTAFDSPGTYTLTFHTLDCPVLVVPVTKADPALDPRAPPHEFSGPDDEALYNLCELHCTPIDPIVLACPVDDPEAMAGLPVGLQIVGERNDEEALLAIGELVDRALKNA